MSNFTPINLPSIQAKQAQLKAGQALAEQVLSQDRFIEDVDQGFNPGAAALLQSRFNRFRPLHERRRSPESKESRRIEGVSKKTEEDLAGEFHKRNPELPADRLGRLRRSLTDTMTEDEILSYVNESFKDPTLADEALEYLERATTGNLQATVRRAREILNEERRREIVAGRNITPVARLFFGKGLGDNPSELRDLYREMTSTIRDHNTLFKTLSEKFAFDDLKLVVAFLLQGLSFDLKSKGPSIQQAELILLMTEVRNLQSILWVYLFFKSRMKLIKSMHAKKGLSMPKSLRFERLAQEFIKLVEERYPTVVRLLKQMDDMDIVDDERKVILLSQYRDAIRSLSTRVYKSQRHQQDLLMVILEALEELEPE